MVVSLKLMAQNNQISDDAAEFLPRYQNRKIGKAVRQGRRRDAADCVFN